MTGKGPEIHKHRHSASRSKRVSRAPEQQHRQPSTTSTGEHVENVKRPAAVQTHPTILEKRLLTKHPELHRTARRGRLSLNSNCVSYRRQRRARRTLRRRILR